MRQNALMAPLLKGGSLRGSLGAHINPNEFIPRLLELHRQGRFPVDRLIRNYPFVEVNTPIADSLSGATKPSACALASGGEVRA